MSTTTSIHERISRGGWPHRAWVWYVVACSVGILAYFFLPSVASQNLALIGSSLVGAAAISLALRLHRPAGRGAWRLLAAYCLFTAGGNTIWFLYDSVLEIDPFPSPGDALFLGGYVIEAAGLLFLIRRRNRGRDVAALLDAAIITTGFAVVSWVFLISPLTSDPTLTLGGKLTSLGYPAADLLVLLIGVRLFVGRAVRIPAFRLLGATLFVQLLADTIFALLNLNGTYNTGHPVDALILTYNLGLGAAALHPTMSALAQPMPPLSARVSARRLTVLTLASLLAPAVLLGQVLTDHFAGLAVTATGGIVLFLLVLSRMAGLVRFLDRTLASRQALEQELEHLVRHDPLTGLANRRLLTERLAKSTSNAAQMALLYVDLDDFKGVNDRFGHATGDALLVAVAHRLNGCVRDTDTVARIGGDEFAVLLCDADRLRAEDVAARILHSLRDPITLPDTPTASIHASLGIALAEPLEPPEHLLQHADQAMYQAKTSGKNRYQTLDGNPPQQHAKVLQGP